MTMKKNLEESQGILEALGIKDLEPAEQEELLLDLGELVTRGTMLRLIERMDEKTQDDFSALLDRDPEDEEVEAFLKERVPDADSAVEETLEELRSDILAVTS
jgi:hypothetical protein